ncbi:MAG: XRE family transcriptional regulator [Gammaproteobacteria bacterium]|nr:XRE family transcriptional regulator [Gammaproteobacteria bacterium]MDE0302416.1 XRE family transcriptional regulator [Gammaproteobacteria bacterium]MDE0611496.1 XRE family transcriptional regulator [Gammaproteobacteria bacterium]
MDRKTSKTLEEVLNQLSPEQRKKIDERTDELIAEIMSLRDLRKVREKTQEHVAEVLEITQENVSRIERRRDLLVSTLRRHVEALGGRLSLIAKFPDRPPVELTGIADSDDSKSPAQS